MPDLVWDEEFADMLLAAVVEHENDRPRNQQIQIGPSGLGSCREYIRHVMVGTVGVPEQGWKSAAFMGTVIGEALEEIFGERLGALVQQLIRTKLPTTGLEVEGHGDAVFVNQNIVTDIKTVDGFEIVRYEGPKFEHLVQVSVYALGLVQMGYLKEGCSARLVYVDRSGGERKFLALPISWEGILNFVALAEDRLRDVVTAQEELDKGNTEFIHALRDKQPSWCFSQKVQCPFRFECWDGSDWAPPGEITDEDQLQDVANYVEGRRMEKAGKEMRESARAALKGVTGMTPDGTIVSWTNENRDGEMTRLNVTEMP